MHNEGVEIHSFPIGENAERGALFSKDGKTLECCPAGKSGSYSVPGNVTSIAGGAFIGCNKLTSIALPAGATNIGYSTFQYCSTLTSLTLPSSVTGIDSGAFANCASLTGLTLAVSGSYSLADAGKINSAAIPDSKTITAAVVRNGGTLTVETGIKVPVTLEAGGTVVNNSGEALDVTGPDGETVSLPNGESKAEPAPQKPTPAPAPVYHSSSAPSYTSYETAYGNGSTWMGEGEITFRIDAELSQFLTLRWKDAELARGTDYDVKEGSTVVSLSPSWLATLPDGSYTLEALFVGGDAELNFNVLKAAAAKPETLAPTESPKTGAEESFLPAAALLLGGGLLLVLVRKRIWKRGN